VVVQGEQTMVEEVVQEDIVLLFQEEQKLH
jgi:hypothetical protein